MVWRANFIHKHVFKNDLFYGTDIKEKNIQNVTCNNMKNIRPTGRSEMDHILICQLDKQTQRAVGGLHLFPVNTKEQ